MWINLISLMLCLCAIGVFLRKGNYLSFIITGIFCILHVGQAIYIRSEVLPADYDGAARMLDNEFNQDGLFRAEIWIFVVSLAFLVFSITSSGIHNGAVSFIRPRKGRKSPGFIMAIMSAAIILFSFIYLISLVGGLDNYLFLGRPMSPGMTVPICLLIVPIYLTIYLSGAGFRVGHVQLLLCFISILIAFSLSRIVGFSYFLTLMLSPMSPVKINRVRFISAISLLFVVFLAWGAYREFISQDSDSEKLTNAMTFAHNYQFGIEATSGLAAAMSSPLVEGHDLGISLMSTPLAIIPAQLRGDEGQRLLEGIRDQFANSTFSIVPSGMECFYIHFGEFGLLIYIALCIFMMRLGTTAVFFPKEAFPTRYYVVTPCVIASAPFFVRGSTLVALNLVITWYIVSWLCYFIVRLMKQEYNAEIPPINK